MPPPEPRSSTTSPASSFASAVGLPQPSEALNASSGTWPISDIPYRLEVIGSPDSPEADGAVPQHEVFPAKTCWAAFPYFSRTTSVMLGSVMVSSSSDRGCR